MNTDLTSPQRSYRRELLITTVVILTIGGIYDFIRLRYVFQGVALPLVVVDSLPHPPPAWLIVDNQAIPATFGDYCWHHPLWGGECVTAAKAEDIPALATVTLPPGHAPVIVVDAGGAMVFQPTIRAWNSPATPVTGQQLRGIMNLDGPFTSFTLQQLDQVNDQILEVQVMPTGTKRATYLWHLNPQP